jgi:uncharacterized membrane protein (UPF0127 family)
VSHFLRPLLKRGASDPSLVNERTGSILAQVVEVAVDSPSRRRGLLGRNCLPERHALVLAPCNAIHTCFMRFPIDVLFVARDGRVVKIVDRIGAWRVTASLRAFAAIEFPAGTLRRGGVGCGDRIIIQSTTKETTASS